MSRDSHRLTGAATGAATDCQCVLVALLLALVCGAASLHTLGLPHTQRIAGTHLHIRFQLETDERCSSVARLSECYRLPEPYSKDASADAKHFLILKIISRFQIPDF